MMNSEPVDVSKLLLEGSSFGAGEVSELQRAVAGNPREVRQRVDELRRRVDSGNGSDRDRLALGIAANMLADHKTAIANLDRFANGNGWADYYRACSLESLGRFEEAAKAFESAGKSGFDAVQAVLSQAGAMRRNRQVAEAEALLKANSRTAVSRADYCYQMGSILSDKGDTYGAIEYFERAVDMDPHHSKALFRLGSLNASFGNDEEAIKLYERALSKPPYHIGALINLGLLYEDIERYDAAAFCFKRVLEYDYNHERARLYLKDIEAASDMWVDEEALRREREMDQVLRTPISDFELSARSRNCLDRLGIVSLGDLTNISEAELMASKNFGETSLKEVRVIMESKGLSVGMNIAEKRQAPQMLRREDLSDTQRALYDKPVSELQLSVRARKCVSRLGLSTIGELMNRSPDDLLAVRNFGVTSLNEIRAKLHELGVSLRND